MNKLLSLLFLSLTSCISLTDAIVLEPLGHVVEIDEKRGFAVVCFENSRTNRYDCKAFELCLMDSVYVGKKIRF